MKSRRRSVFFVADVKEQREVGHRHLWSSHRNSYLHPFSHILQQIHENMS